MSDVCGLVVLCLVGSDVYGTFMFVCRRMRFKFDLVLVHDSLSCILENYFNEKALSYDIVSIVFLCVETFFVEGG